MPIKIVTSPNFQKLDSNLISGITEANLEDQIGTIPGRNFGFHVGDSESAVTQNYIDLKNQLFGNQKIVHIVPNQTHSKNVLVVTDASKVMDVSDFDAVVTNVKGVVIGVLSADCVPILLFDNKNKVLGAVHAGWKGTAQKIVQVTIEQMRLSFNTNPKDVHAYIGPCISQSAYEVDSVVSNQMHSESYIPGISIGKFQLDLKKENQLQLLECNVDVKNIEISKDCTYSMKEKYYSARRNGFHTGRMLTFICLKNPSNTNL
jgi:YfiH family protein